MCPNKDPDNCSNLYYSEVTAVWKSHSISMIQKGGVAFYLLNYVYNVKR